MRRVFGFLIVAIAMFVLSNEARGQRREICGEEWVFSDTPSNLRQSSVIYGQVSIEGPNEVGKVLKVVVRLRDGHSIKQHSFKGSGSYCFEKSSGGGGGGPGGEITVDINGEEVESRPLIPNQPEQREDFKIRYTSRQTSAPPGVVSAKFNYKRNAKNAALFEKSARAAADGKLEVAIKYLTEIVTDDPADYVARATLGGAYYQQKKHAEAETWFKRAVETNPDFAPAWLSLARSQYAQEKYDAAIESCKSLLKLEPNSAAAFYILGEAYLRTQKGDLAAHALYEAIKLDPVGMAECHLILADLYDFNGAKNLASKEYKAFIAKIPNHRDKLRIEQYIKDNPE